MSFLSARAITEPYILSNSWPLFMFTRVAMEVTCGCAVHSGKSHSHIIVPAMDFFSSIKLDALRTLLLSSIQVNIEGLAKTKSRHPRSTAAYKLSKDIATTWKLIPPILGPTTSVR